MAVYLITTYDIIDEDKYAPYIPNSLRLLEKYGGSVVSADKNAVTVDGDHRDINVILKFPSTEVALQMLDDPEYIPWKEIRLASTTNRTSILVNEFDASLFVS